MSDHPVAEPSPVPHAEHAEHAAAPGAHGHDDHDFWGHAKLYLWVGAILILFTAVTVFLSYVDFGSTKANIIVGMIVATFKVCLVGAIFMHLKEEKKTIWRPLLFTLFFVLGLFLLTLLAFYDPIFGTYHAYR